MTLLVQKTKKASLAKPENWGCQNTTLEGHNTTLGVSKCTTLGVKIHYFGSQNTLLSGVSKYTTLGVSKYTIGGGGGQNTLLKGEGVCGGFK